MPAHFFDGDAYSELGAMGDDDQSFQAGHYFDGTEYTTVFKAVDPIDTFEADEPPAARYDLDGSGDASITSQAALHPDSSQGLRLDNGFRQAVTVPSDGELESYPEVGRAHTFLVHPRDLGTNQYWYRYAESGDAQNPGETIRIELGMDGFFRIRVNGDVEESAEVPVDWSSRAYLVGTLIDGDIESVLYEYDNGDLTEIQNLYSSSDGGVSGELGVGWRTSGGRVDWDHYVHDD